MTMESFIDNIVVNFKAVSWEGPVMFLIIILAVLSVSRQWHILLLVLMTVVIGWGAEDIMLMNIETSNNVISLSLVIYCCGGEIALILSLLAFFKFALK